MLNAVLNEEHRYIVAVFWPYLRPGVQVLAVWYALRRVQALAAWYGLSAV